MRDSTKLHPNLQAFAVFALYQCYKAGLHVRITETYRTVAEQDNFYKQGISQVRGANYGSMHQWGVALDVCRNDGTGAYDFNGWIEKVAKIFKNYGLAWGGDWKGFVDKPHFQMKQYEDSWGGTGSLKRTFLNPDTFFKSFSLDMGIEQFANMNISQTASYIKKHFATVSCATKLWKGRKCLKYKKKIPKKSIVYIIKDYGDGISKVIYLKGNKIYTGYIYNFFLTGVALSDFKKNTLSCDKYLYKNKFDFINKSLTYGSKTKSILKKGTNIQTIAKSKCNRYIRVRYEKNGVWKTGGWILNQQKG